MKRKLLTTAIATLVSVSVCIPAFAGQWVADSTGWWWQNDDGTWPASSWQWIDGNYDGVSECYYFNSEGYLVTDGTTPDGYEVNADGAWIENDVVQTQGTATADAETEAEAETKTTETEAAAEAEAETEAAETEAAAATETESSADVAPDVTGSYTGSYNGQQLKALIETFDDTTYVEIDLFLKDVLPSYQGNGVFADDYNSFQFTDSDTFIYTDSYSGASVTFTRQ
ncbi:MAG: hypothetical protein LUE86_09090 [Clostridiales bacterium]|nr:hypothetical protein [Clostridiales bacterium]